MVSEIHPLSRVVQKRLLPLNNPAAFAYAGETDRLPYAGDKLKEEHEGAAQSGGFEQSGVQPGGDQAADQCGGSGAISAYPMKKR